MYESPRRVERLLKGVVSVLGGNVKVAVCRELTKKHQEVLRGGAGELLKQELDEIKGEIVVVVDNRPNAQLRNKLARLQRAS